MLVSNTKNKLPDFIIIGGARCGTTSLSACLNQHPDIGMAKIKEPEFFCENKNWEKGLPWYKALFPGNSKLCFEASTSYSKFPVFPNVPQKIFKIVPDIKFIYILRNPVERAVSHYKMAVAQNHENRNINNAFLDTEHPQTKFYLNCSSYYYQLEQYLQFFNLEQFLLINFERMVNDTFTALNEIYSFLDVNGSLGSMIITKKNASNPFQQYNTIGNVFRKYLGNRITAKLPLTQIKRSLDHTEIDNEVLTRIKIAVSKDMQKLEKIVKFDISHWIE